ncbi:MAG: class I SAM-dependent methyltransferase [Chloroflexi bacterium]|nr:class I SAM-dependent methyltransferase [Chloroflexota bacterium]
MANQYEFVAGFYDHVAPYVERRDMEFYVGLAIESRGPVLELGCGTGRVLIPISRAGIQITGIDMSEHMLAVCREKLPQEPVEVQDRVKLVVGDIRQFDLGRRFRLVIIPFRPFQHLVTVEDQLNCLACAHRHLEPGGRLAMDVFNPDLSRLVNERLLEEMGDEPPFEMPDGRRVVRKFRIVSIDLHKQVRDTEIIYYVTYPDGRQERLVHPFPFRYFFRYEVEHLLTRTGFEVEEVCSDFDGSPYGSKYPGELIFVGRRG